MKLPTTSNASCGVVVPMPTEPPNVALLLNMAKPEKVEVADEKIVAEMLAPEIFPPLIVAFVIVGAVMFVPVNWSMRWLLAISL